MRTHTVVWGHIYSSMRTHTVVCGHIYSSMRTHTVVWGHIYRSVCAHTDELLFPSAPPRMRLYYVHFIPRMRSYFAALRRLISQRSALISALFFCMHFDLYALIAQRSGASARSLSLVFPRLRCVCALIFPSAPLLNRGLIEPSIRAHCKDRLVPVFLEYCKGVSSCIWFFFPDCFLFFHTRQGHRELSSVIW